MITGDEPSRLAAEARARVLATVAISRSYERRKFPFHPLPNSGGSWRSSKTTSPALTPPTPTSASATVGSTSWNGLRWPSAALANLRPLAEVAAIQGGIQKQQKRAPRTNAFPFLRVANVTPRGLDLGEVHQIELFGGELDRLRLASGGLLVVEGNGSPSQIGRASLWDGSIPDCVHQNHLIRVRPSSELVPEHLEAVWNSPQNRAKLTEVSSSSSGLHTLSVSKLKQLSIPVPSLERHRELVDELDRVREARDRLGWAVIAASARRNALRRSLLAAAFSGRLTGDRELAGV